MITSLRLVSFLILAAAPAHAQVSPAPGPAPQAAAEAGPSEVTSYPPSFFASYNPINAWDMVNRIPGFSVDDGSDVRGLSGTAGNVLIDGERPPGKTDLGDILDRLRADEVARIDLIRGGAPGIDMQGKLLVINIIRRARTGGYSGAVEVGTQYYPGLDRGDGSVDLTGAWELANGVKLDGELSYNQAKGQAPPGESRVRLSPTGALISSVSEESDDYEEEISGMASIEFGLFGGEARLTGAAETGREGERETETFHTGPPRLTDEAGEESSTELEGSYAYSLANGGSLQAIFSQNWSEESSDSTSLSGRPPTADRSDESGGEIGVTASYPLGRGVRLQSVFARSWDEESSTSTSLRSDGTLSGEIDYEEVGETALRTSLFLDPHESVSAEVGAEAAYNFLEGSSEISLDGVTLQVPGSQAKVEEKRGEAFAVATWRFRSYLTLEGAVRYEFSTLTTSGARKGLNFLKPMLQARWELAPGRLVLARVERTVGQLNFGDFLSSASISEFDEIITAGAVELTPTQVWTSSLQFDQRFWDTGVFRVDVEYRALSDVIGNRPIVTTDGAFEGTGNIGEGRQAYFNAEFDAPLDRMGLVGARLIIDGQILLSSELTDPFTGEKRAFDGERDYNLGVDFEHEIRAWDTTWGASFDSSPRRFFYRSNSIEVSEEGPYVSAFVSYRPDRNSTFRLQIDNALPRRFESRRDVYLGRRDITPTRYIETRRSESVPSVRLTYRRATG